MKKIVLIFIVTLVLFTTRVVAQSFSSHSFKVSVGVGMNEGLLGTGGWPDEGNTSSEYFFKLYYGGYLGGGIRINPPHRRIAYEFTPINIYFGNDYFFMVFYKFGIDIKLNKND